MKYKHYRLCCDKNITVSHNRQIVKNIFFVCENSQRVTDTLKFLFDRKNYICKLGNRKLMRKYRQKKASTLLQKNMTEKFFQMTKINLIVDEYDGEILTHAREIISHR